MTKNVKILIVDDQYEKVQKLLSVIEAKDNIEFEHVSSSKETLKKLEKEHYDILIIDLQIPDNLGDQINPLGGKHLLEYIEENVTINIPTHILGLTSHIESYDECKDAFLSRGWSLIIRPGQDDLLQKVITSQIKHTIEKPENFDVAIVTALEHTELESILNLPCSWIPIIYETDCNIYHVGEVQNKTGKEISIIATCCHHMGIANSAAVAMKMCLKFKPKYIIMSGISAGIKGKVNIGDILIADPCWDWGNGKQTILDGKPKFLSAPRQIPLDPSLRAMLKRLSTTREYLDEIISSWPHDSRPHSSLNAHVGPVATGSMVLEDPSVVEMIQSQHRETIGVEMEAYGFAVASSISCNIPPKWLVIKSVCDFADPTKNNDWQKYAAFTSAQYLYKIIKYNMSF